MASRSTAAPVIGAYWLWPARMAASSASTRRCGTGKSGNPWPRFTAPCSAASCDITVKMVVPTRGSLVGGICGGIAARRLVACGDSECTQWRPPAMMARRHPFRTIPMSRDLLVAYLGAEYRIDPDGSGLLLHVGAPAPPALARMLPAARYTL